MTEYRITRFDPKLPKRKLPRRRLWGGAEPSVLNCLYWRFRWSKRMKRWPWAIPREVVRYVRLPTERDMEAGQEVARKRGLASQQGDSE